MLAELDIHTVTERLLERTDGNELDYDDVKQYTQDVTQEIYTSVVDPDIRDASYEDIQDMYDTIISKLTSEEKSREDEVRAKEFRNYLKRVSDQYKKANSKLLEFTSFEKSPSSRESPQAHRVWSSRRDEAKKLKNNFPDVARFDRWIKQIRTLV
jgi:hypothetical protein